MEKVLRRTWAEIDLDALCENMSQVCGNTNKAAKICAVVKADGYGHGAVRVARVFENSADWFAVSNLEEALELRFAGIKKPILILGYTPAEKAGTLCEYDISQCVYSSEYAKELSLKAETAGVRVNIHVKVDTGMSRLGFCFQNINTDTDTVEEIEAVCSLPGLRPQGIFTHFASSDEGKDGDAFTMTQYGCFKELLEALQRKGVVFEIRHCANSAGIFDYPMSHLDMVRAGIVLYGLYPSAAVRNRPELKPALSLHSVVSQVKTLRAGAAVSYGRTFTAPKDMKIATVPIGYADGYPRILGSKGAYVLIDGKRCPVIGRICMDQMMVDASSVPSLNVDDDVILIGRQGNEEIFADTVASWQESINYEVICGLSRRVPRLYLQNGSVESVYDQLLDGFDTGEG